MAAENDSPPGAPPYASGPLANTPPPPAPRPAATPTVPNNHIVDPNGDFHDYAPPKTVGAFLASGQPNLPAYLNPPPMPPPPIVGAQPKPIAQSFMDRISALSERAGSGIRQMFGNPAAPAPYKGDAVTQRTQELEGGLDELQKKSAPNVLQQRMEPNDDVESPIVKQSRSLLAVRKPEADLPPGLPDYMGGKPTPTPTPTRVA